MLCDKLCDLRGGLLGHFRYNNGRRAACEFGETSADKEAINEKDNYDIDMLVADDSDGG
jgi:hypothetical protein